MQNNKVNITLAHIKFFLMILFLGLQMGCTQHEDKKAQVDAEKENVVVCTKPLHMKDLIDQKEWDEVYRIFDISKDKQLTHKDILAMANENLAVLSMIDGVGISLEENNLNLKSVYAVPKLAYQQYTIQLNGDQLQYQWKQDSSETSTIKYMDSMDGKFKDLCLDSPKKYIDIAQFVLNRAAIEFYMYNLKDEGYL